MLFWGWGRRSLQRQVSADTAVLRSYRYVHLMFLFTVTWGYDYALATVFKFQLHDHIARKILKQDPRDCNYFGNREVGAFLREILALGATRDWNQVLREATGEGISARPMMEYFAPLLAELRRENRDRKVGWY